jgi:hypothetical protein
MCRREWSSSTSLSPFSDTLTDVVATGEGAEDKSLIDAVAEELYLAALM